MPWRWPWYRKPAAAAAVPADHPLREFVYLDEVTVYSLLASRNGPVPTDFTDTESQSLKDELTAGVTLGLPGAAADAGTSSETTRATTSQIVRKSSAQARFKQFVEAEHHHFTLTTSPAADRAPAVHRGGLFELHVELAAEETFQIATTITALVEILTQDAAQLAADIDRGQLEQVLAFNRILERLLVGLVPIKARAVEYTVIQQDGQPRIVPAATVNPGENTEPLYIVAFTGQDLYWKDLRTVLFGQQRYILTGRSAVDRVQDRWSPVKLADVLRTVLPELAEQLDDAGSGFRTAIRTTTATGTASDADGALTGALIEFAERITSPPVAAAEVRELLTTHSPLHGAALDGTLEQTRAVFARTVQLLRDRYGDERVEGHGIPRHRSDVIVEHGLPPAPERPQATTTAAGQAPEHAWYLEAEVIAVHW